MKNTSKFQNVVIATIVGWLVLFVFLPNLMIIATSFLTRDDANFVKLVFTLDTIRGYWIRSIMTFCCIR